MSKEFPVLHDLISPPSSLMCSWFSSHTGSFSVLQTCQHRSHYDVHKWWSFCSQNSSLDLEMTTCSFIIIQFSFQMQGPRCVSQSHPPPQQHVLNRAASRLFIHSWGQGLDLIPKCLLGRQSKVWHLKSNLIIICLLTITARKCVLFTKR